MGGDFGWGWLDPKSTHVAMYYYREYANVKLMCRKLLHCPGKSTEGEVE